MGSIKLFTSGEGQIGKGSNNEQYYSPGNIKRIVPIDDYKIDPAITDRASQYHFIKVPLLGQCNPKTYAYGGQGDWCGRTSSTMVYNYHLLVMEKIKAAEDYISMYDPTEDGRIIDAAWEMELRKKDDSIAFKGYSLSDNLEADIGEGFLKERRLFKSFGEYAKLGRSLDQRVQDAQALIADDETIDHQFKKMIRALKANNPIVFYSGFSISGKFKSHIICICGFCYIPERGVDKLWILIADPASTPRAGGRHDKLNKIFYPIRKKDGSIAKRAEDDPKLLDLLDESKPRSFRAASTTTPPFRCRLTPIGSKARSTTTTPTKAAPVAAIIRSGCNALFTEACILCRGLETRHRSLPGSRR